MGKCPLCGSNGDDLVFRFYCSNGKCSNFVPENDDHKILPKGEIYSFSQPEFVGKFPKVDSPLFRIASFERRPLPMPPPSQIFFMPSTYAKEVIAEWLDTDRDFEVMKKHIYAGLGIPREFIEPGYGSLPGKDFPHFKLVLSPFDNSVMLSWYDQVPAVLNTLINPILESKVGTSMTSRLEGTTQHQIIERLLDMVRRGQLVRNEARRRWELHFTE